MTTAGGGGGCDPAAALAAALERHVPDCRRAVVAFSGGPDSTLLLHLVSQRLARRRVLAVYVDHGWHADPARWVARCRAVARGLGVGFEAVAVEARPGAGEGPEAAARDARYAALARYVGEHEALLTAHHRDDQAETVLLALLRGGGVHGLAGMPAMRAFGAGGVHLRPWVGIPRAALAAEVDRRGLAPLDDPANHDRGYDRVWLRTDVLPLLRERRPEIERTLARAADQAAEAAAGVDALAARDFVGCRGRRAGTLDCRALAWLPTRRQRALLRWWLQREGLTRPPAPRLESLRRQLAEAAADRTPRVAWRGGEVRRWRGQAWALAPQPALEPGATYRWDDRSRPLELPHRRLEPRELKEIGIDPGTAGEVVIGFRRGGERLDRGDGRGTVALKRWLADAGVPPWERDRVPLVYVDGRLIGVLGVGVAARSRG